MKIIISSTGKKWSDSIDPQFEHAKGFVLLNEETNRKSWHSNEDNMNTTQDSGIQEAQFVVNTGATVLITGSMGPEALMILNHSIIKIYEADDLSVKEGWVDYKGGILAELIQHGE